MENQRREKGYGRTSPPQGFFELDQASRLFGHCKSGNANSVTSERLHTRQVITAIMLKQTKCIPQGKSICTDN